MATTYKPEITNLEIEELMKRAYAIPNVAEIFKLIEHANKVTAMAGATSAASSISPRLGSVFYASATRMV